MTTKARREALKKIENQIADHQRKRDALVRQAAELKHETRERTNLSRAAKTQAQHHRRRVAVIDDAIRTRSIASAWPFPPVREEAGA